MIKEVPDSNYVHASPEVGASVFLQNQDLVVLSSILGGSFPLRTESMHWKKNLGPVLLEHGPVKWTVASEKLIRKYIKTLHEDLDFPLHRC